jgi:hypothetical protein
MDRAESATPALTRSARALLLGRRPPELGEIIAQGLGGGRDSGDRLLRLGASDLAARALDVVRLGGSVRQSVRRPLVVVGHPSLLSLAFVG